MTHFLGILAALVAAHAVCDFPLQGDFLARGKNVSDPLPGVPWWICLTAHAVIQAAGVYVVTRNSGLAAIEFANHWYTDFVKCSDDSVSFALDQAGHIGMKVLFAVALSTGWL